MRHVILLAYANVDDLDFFGTFSVLSKAAAAVGPGFFKVACRERTLRLSSGVEVDLGLHWVPLASAASAKALIVPGGPGASAAANDGDFTRVLLAARASDVSFYVCCTGASILAAIGLLDGMTVAMHHLKQTLLAGSGCAAVVGGLVRDRWLTSVAGDMASSVKSVDLVTQLMHDLAPDTLQGILKRMELSEGRHLRIHSAAAV
jgi:putative intracellular protease/amidase